MEVTSPLILVEGVWLTESLDAQNLLSKPLPNPQALICWGFSTEFDKPRRELRCYT
jgi:hypothetical protein